MRKPLLFSLGFSFTLFAGQVKAQCILDAPCDDGDTCTTNDVVIEVIPGTAICDSGSVEISNPSSDLSSDSLTLADQQFVSPFLFDYAAKMSKHQWLFLRSELDVEMNQLNGHPDATGGLGTCEPVTAIAFYVNDTITVDHQKHLLLSIQLKHAPIDVHDLSLGFDQSGDTAAGCFGGLVLTMPELGPPGWRTFTLTEPFLWDGERDVIVQWAVNIGNENMLDAPLPVRYTAIEGDAPANQLTYAVTALPPYTGPCNPTVTNNICNSTVLAAALSSTAPCYETQGSANLRPSIMFIGGVDTAPPATCICAGTEPDTDFDGLIDCEDLCPLGPNPGDFCDDGNPNTINDAIDSTCICVGDFGTGLPEEHVAGLAQAWPNPNASDVLYLRAVADGTVLDAEGRIVRTFARTQRIDLSGLRAGLYLVRCTNGEQVRLIRE